MEPLKDYIIVAIDSQYNEDTNRIGLSGKNIIQIVDKQDDATRNSHLVSSGEVVAIPRYLSKSPILQKTLGSPNYASKVSWEWYYLRDIEQDVKVGDKAYFHFNVVGAGYGKHNLLGVDEKGRMLYKCRYDMVQCVVRKAIDVEGFQEEIIMIGGYCLIKPDMETWDDILIPVPMIDKSTGKPLVDAYGKSILKPKDQWIQKKLEPEALFLQGHVVHSGPPFKGDFDELKAGDKIWYHKNADWELTIEGVNFYVIRQKHITMKESPNN